jgi:hypothetical protein
MEGTGRAGNKCMEQAEQGTNVWNRQSREQIKETGQSRERMEGTVQTRKPLESIPGLLKRLQIRTLNKLTHPRLENKGHLGEPSEGKLGGGGGGA